MDQQRDGGRRVLAAARAVGEDDIDGVRALLMFNSYDEQTEFLLRTLGVTWALLKALDDDVEQLVRRILFGMDDLDDMDDE
jgi:hypothetical protein